MLLTMEKGSAIPKEGSQDSRRARPVEEPFAA